MSCGAESCMVIQFPNYNRMNIITLLIQRNDLFAKLLTLEHSIELVTKEIDDISDQIEDYKDE